MTFATVLAHEKNRMTQTAWDKAHLASSLRHTTSGNTAKQLALVKDSIIRNLITRKLANVITYKYLCSIRIQNCSGWLHIQRKKIEMF